MKLRTAIIVVLLPLLGITWAHSLIPHRHEVLPAVTSASQIEKKHRDHPEHHHHHHHHYHPSTSLLSHWLEWLKARLGDFEHTDLGEKHLEVYYKQHIIPNLKPVPAAALLPLPLERKQLAEEPRQSMTGLPAVRAPDPPGRNSMRTRAPPALVN